jgi:hypothetical protein
LHPLKALLERDGCGLGFGGCEFDFVVHA